MTFLHATGLLSVDGYDFCTYNRTAVSWRLWLFYMQQDCCQLTLMTFVHATGLLSVDGYDFFTCNRTAVSWRLRLFYMQQDCCQLMVMTFVYATGLSFDGYDFCTCNRTAVSWRLWLPVQESSLKQCKLANRSTSGTVPSSATTRAALWLFLDSSVIFVAEEASFATIGATKVLPKPLVCNGNQRHSIISQILHQAAARKVMNLVYCLQRRLPAYWWPHPSVSNPPFLIKYLLT